MGKKPISEMSKEERLLFGASLVERQRHLQSTLDRATKPWLRSGGSPYFKYSDPELIGNDDRDGQFGIAMERCSPSLVPYGYSREMEQGALLRQQRLVEFAIALVNEQLAEISAALDDL